MESIDDLLAQVKAEYQEKDSIQQPKKKSLLEEAEFQSPDSVQSTYSSACSASSVSSLSRSEENLLADLKAEFKAQEQAEELKKQEEIREEQQKIQQREQRRKEALTQQATDWLKQLNPHSEEGRWFEDFSYSYASKLEAAIDYLQALKETP